MTTSLNQLTPVQKKLMLLLQYGLWGKSIDVNLFEKASKQEWEEVMDLASVQGVFALVYDGVNGLPEELRPPKDLLIRWGLGVNKIEARYHFQKKALQSLSALYKNHDIRCLIFKGIAISQLYPVQAHRESGDLDIYLFGDYEKGNLLMEESGLHVDYECTVHSKFLYQNIPVENHRSFCSLDWQKADVDFENLLQQKLCDEPPVYSEELGVYIPLSSFNLLFLYKHAIKHFIASGIVLRHLCDLAFLLKNCQKEDEYASFYKMIKLFGLQNYVNAFNAIIFDYLGLPVNHTYPVKKDQKFTKKMLNDILAQKKIYPIAPRETFMSLLMGKIRGSVFIFTNRWKYKAGNKMMFTNELLLRMNLGFKHFKEL